MWVNVIIHCGEEMKPGVLTTEHAASSYGLPILLLDGKPHGPGDLPGAVLTIPDASPEVIRAARRAGWRIKEVLTHKMSCLLTEETYEKLRQISFEQRKTIGTLIREAIEQYLKGLERRPE